jgi:secreted trypsin-like serine protease
MSLLRRAALAAALVSSVVPASALAITNGTPDGSSHPAVGLLVTGPARTPVCSGALIGPQTFLTAGHCVAGADGTSLAVEFDTDFVAASGYAVEPGYGHDNADPRDVAVVMLERAPTGIAPLPLGPLGALDRTDKRTSLTTVGYGYYERVTGNGPPRFLYDGVRRQATAPLMGVENAWAKVLSNARATGQGGVCFGDSGGPWLLDGAIVAITSGGDMACAGMSNAYRIDTAESQAFLAQYG